MSHQSDKDRASITWFAPDKPLQTEDELPDTAPCEYQPVGVDEKEEKEPQGSPSY